MDTNLLAEQFFEFIEKRYGFGKHDLLEILKDKKGDDLLIPYAIFSDKLGIMESIVKYLHENKGLSFKDIASLTGRDNKNIWKTYQKASSKLGSRLKEGSDGFALEIIKSARFSAFESIMYHIMNKNKQIDIKDLSEKLKRKPTTIRTIFYRVRNKVNADAKLRRIH